MSHTYTSTLTHCVFSTKGRKPLIHDELRPALWAYMGGIARKNKMKALAVGGTSDHVHLLLLMEAVGSHLEEYDAANGLRILKPDKVAAVEKLFNGLELKLDWKQFTRIAPGGFIDVRLEGAQVQ